MTPTFSATALDGFLWLVMQTAALPTACLLLGFIMGWRWQALTKPQRPQSDTPKDGQPGK